MKLFKHRKLYDKDSLSIHEIGDKPMKFFIKWFKEADEFCKSLGKEALENPEIKGAIQKLSLKQKNLNLYYHKT